MVFKVAEKFVSINGEGRKAGQPAVFIRLTGCNLSCSYCDTRWAAAPDAESEELTEEDIASYIRKTGIKNVTLTGGEPLAADGADILLSRLAADDIGVEIETNGSRDISVCGRISPRPSVTMDYKLPSSGMEKFMRLENFDLLSECDTVKFVAGTQGDLERALEVIKQYSLIGRCAVYISPVFGRLAPSAIVDFMLANKLNGVNIQLQLHKYIWDPERRGV